MTTKEHEAAKAAIRINAMRLEQEFLRNHHVELLKAVQAVCARLDSLDRQILREIFKS